LRIYDDDQAGLEIENPKSACEALWVCGIIYEEQNPMKKALTILLLISSLTLTHAAFAEERWRIYDRKGRYEGTVQKNDAGRMKMYDRKGRYQGYIKDDRVYDRDGTLEHRIVPEKTDKKK
jgi:hypothetical protein